MYELAHTHPLGDIPEAADTVRGDQLKEFLDIRQHETTAIKLVVLDRDLQGGERVGGREGGREGGGEGRRAPFTTLFGEMVSFLGVSQMRPNTGQMQKLVAAVGEQTS